MSQFITKENVHEATDVSRIRRLMANAERLGEVELVKQCSDRLKILTASKKIKKAEHDPLDVIPDIDFSIGPVSILFMAINRFKITTL